LFDEVNTMKKQLPARPAMRRRLVLMGLLALSPLGAAGQTALSTAPNPALNPPIAPARMPMVHTESLAEMALDLPKDLPGPRSLVLMGFEFDHQAVMAAWVEKMNLRRDQLPWLQTHLIPRPWGLISGFVNSRKRPYFPDAYMREPVAPVYTDVSGFIAAMGFPDSRKQVLLAVVQPDGCVPARAEGNFNPAQAEALLMALKGTAPSQ
jgi:hypothetical protein